VALAGDGNTAIMGGPDDNHCPDFADNCLGAVGAVWVFTRSNGIWTQQAKLPTAAGTPSQGSAVAISADSSTALVGGYTAFQNTPPFCCAAVGEVSAYALPHFAFDAPSSTAGGAPTTFLLSALDANGLLLDNYAGTVHFASSDFAAMLPADSTLSNGTGNFSATLETVGAQTITARDTANGGIVGTTVISVAAAATVSRDRISSHIR